MLLTCNASSLKSLIKPPRGAKPKLALADLPSFVRRELDLHGVNLSTDLLVGATRTDLTTIRDRADKAGCACLTLIEPDPLDLATENDKAREAAIARGKRVVEAAHILGCSAAVISLKDAKGEDVTEYAIDSLRQLMGGAEKRDLNLLLAPAEGMTADPEALTDLVKKTGGFRVGTYPDLAVAAESPDPEAYLRRITPYAAALRAGLFEFSVQKIEIPDEPGMEGDEDEDDEFLDDIDLGPTEIVTHTTYALDPLVAAITAVGYDQTIGIEYRGKGDPVEGIRHARAALEDTLLRAQSAG